MPEKGGVSMGQNRTIPKSMSRTGPADTVKAASGKNHSKSAGSISATGIAAAIVAIMPKCPLCWMALAGAAGLDSWVLQGWMRPVAVILLAGALFTLLFVARSRRAYGPFWLALVAALAMYALKFANGPELGVYLSGAALVAASVWNALPERGQECCNAGFGQD